MINSAPKQPIKKKTPQVKKHGPEAKLTRGGDAAALTPEHNAAPAALSHLKGLLHMARALGRRAADRKAETLWHFLRFAVAGINFWIGGTYLFAGHALYVEPTYRLLVKITPGGIHTHGLILCLLAFMLASRPAFKRQTGFALAATLFYSVLTAAVLVGGWTLHRPDLEAPAWYVLVAVLAFGLRVTQTPRDDGRNA